MPNRTGQHHPKLTTTPFPELTITFQAPVVVMLTTTTLPPETNIVIGDLELDVPPEEKDFIFYLINSFYVLVLFISTVANLLLVGALISQYKLFLQRPFYILLIQIIFANLFSIISNLITNVPAISFLDSSAVKLYIKSGFYSIFAAVDALSDQATQWLVLVIAAHRFLIFIKPKLSYLWFEGLPLGIISTFIWLIAVADAIFLHITDCSFIGRQSEHLMIIPGTNKADELVYYSYSCNFTGTNYANTDDEAYSKSTLMVFFAQRAIFPMLTIIFYFIVTIKLCFLRKATLGSSYNETQILYQGIFIFIACQIPTAVTVIVYTAEVRRGVAFLFKRILATGNLLSGALPPLFILMTSKEIHTIFRDYFCTKRRKEIFPLSSQQSSSSDINLIK